MLVLAKQGVTGMPPQSRKEAVVSLLKSWGADPFSAGKDDNERTWRSGAADRLLDPFYDHKTGEWHDVPEKDDGIASAQMGGVPKDHPAPTITDAFKAYLHENAKVTSEQRKKQVQRFGRAESRLLATLEGDRPAPEISQADARRWRDKRESDGAAPATVRREMNDIKAVLKWQGSEIHG